MKEIVNVEEDGEYVVFTYSDESVVRVHLDDELDEEQLAAYLGLT